MNTNITFLGNLAYTIFVRHLAANYLGRSHRTAEHAIDNQTLLVLVSLVLQAFVCMFAIISSGLGLHLVDTVSVAVEDRGQNHVTRPIKTTDARIQTRVERAR